MKIGFITDIHEHVKMLEKALTLAEKHGCEAIACLGDMVGYDKRFQHYPETRSAKRCLQLVRSNCRWIVAGNHDLFAARKQPAYTNGFQFPDAWFDMNTAERMRSCSAKVWTFEGELPNDLDHEDIEYLRSLPEHIITTINETKYLFSHYFFPNFSGSTTQYFNNQRQLKGLWQFMEQHSLTFNFCGHAHTSFAEFAYPRKYSLFKTIHAIPSQQLRLRHEPVGILLPPLSGDRGKAGFTIFDTNTRQLNIIYTG